LTNASSSRPGEAHEAFRNRLKAGFNRVLPEATAALQQGPATYELSQQLLEISGRKMLPDLEAAVDELRSVLVGQVPSRIVNPWAGAANALERLIVAVVGFRSLELPIGRPISRSVLERLHGRGVVTAWEVLTLIRASLPSGAAARWRSLHELAVAAVFIAESGEEIAERYVAHETLRRRRVFRELREHGGHWDQMPIPQDVMDRVEAASRAAIERYEPSFGDGDYEWARPAFPKKQKTHKRPPRIGFKDLEDAVGGAPWRLKYVTASEHVHVGDSGGALADDHGWDNPYLLPRWSTHTHGLAGANAAMSLLSITRALVKGSLGQDDTGNTVTADFLLAALGAMRNEVDREFEAVEQGLFGRAYPTEPS
jgi:hypothetical protein